MKYLSRTKVLPRDNTSLPISYMKQRKAISRYTVSQWVKPILRAAGVNVQVFTAHSSHSAKTSTGKVVCLRLTVLLSLLAGVTHR